MLTSRVTAGVHSRRFNTLGSWIAGNQHRARHDAPSGRANISVLRSSLAVELRCGKELLRMELWCLFWRETCGVLQSTPESICPNRFRNRYNHRVARRSQPTSQGHNASMRSIAWRAVSIGGSGELTSGTGNRLTLGRRRLHPDRRPPARPARRQASSVMLKYDDWSSCIAPVMN